MKISANIECSPEEARRFLGLPDVATANQAYVEAVAKAMQGVSPGPAGLDQLQDYAKVLAPMGQVGLKLLEQFVATAARKPQEG